MGKFLDHSKHGLTQAWLEDSNNWYAWANSLIYSDNAGWEATYGANPVCASAACAVLDVIEEEKIPAFNGSNDASAFYNTSIFY